VVTVAHLAEGGQTSLMPATSLHVPAGDCRPLTRVEGGQLATDRRTSRRRTSAD
jgi:hypothetical protein